MARQSYDAGNAFQSLNAATGAATGNEVIFSVGGGRELPYGFTWQVIIGGTGSFTSFKVNLESSLDGVNWAPIDNTTNVAGDLKAVTSTKALMLRTSVASSPAPVIASGAPTITTYIVA